MRTVPRQRSPGRLVAFFSGLAALVFARACFIEIKAPLDTKPDAAAGVGGSVSAGGTAGNGAAGSGGTAGSTSGTSGNDGGGDAPSCGSSTMKRCGDVCVRKDDPALGCAAQACGPCNTNPNAQCSDAGACPIGACKPGFVDCNGSATDGCEVRFGPEPSELPTSGDGGTDTIHRIPGPHDITIDGDRSDWPETIPLVRLTETCVGCQANGTPGGKPGVVVENPSTLPSSRNDLDAYFRFTWNPDSLFLLVLVRDDQPLVSGTATVPNYTPSPAELQDGVEVLIDGDFILQSGYRSETDSHLFIGAAHTSYNANSGVDETNNSNITVARAQIDMCYFVEIQIKSPYVRSSELAPIGVGEHIGFDIAVNDWDTERSLAVRAHQAFWQKPGTLYARDTTNFPKIELVTP